MMMNGWFLAAGALLAAAFFVHVFSGNRFYSAASNAPAARNHPFIIIPFYGKYTPACAGSATQAAASGV